MRRTLLSFAGIWAMALTVAASPGLASSGDVVCTGTAPHVVAHDLIVPSSGLVPLCTIPTGMTVIGHDLVIQPDGRMTTDFNGGLTVRHDIVARQPALVDIGQLGGVTTVGHDVKVDGLGGTLTNNILCNASIGHDLVWSNSAPNDDEIFIGDVCVPPGGVRVGHDGVFQNNQVRLLISKNNAATGGGFGHDLVVTGNSPVTLVQSNAIGHDCRQQGNLPLYLNNDSTSTGPNTAGHDVGACNTPNF